MTVQLVLQVIIALIGVFLSGVLTGFLIQNGRAINEGFREMDKRAEVRHREVMGYFKKMDERTEQISRLIVADGEKTRELFTQLSGKRE